MDEIAVIVQPAQTVRCGQFFQVVFCPLQLGGAVHHLFFQVITGLSKFFLRQLAPGIKQRVVYRKGDRGTQAGQKQKIIFAECKRHIHGLQIDGSSGRHFAHQRHTDH